MSDNDQPIKKDLVYVSESHDDGVDEDIWDDRKLNDAYDKAIKIAHAEVAKRIAMSTNTEQKKKDPAKKVKSALKHTVIYWQSGMPCRAIYEADGKEYEAFVLKIVSDKECIVRFLGYENTEIVAVDTLKPSKGKDARKQQIEQSQEDKSYENNSNYSGGENDYFATGAIPKQEPSIPKQQKKSKKKNAHKQPPREFVVPDMPFMHFQPNINYLGHAPCGVPMPPPMMMCTGGPDDDGMSAMLISWYMSGYYTGLHQGLKRAKEATRNGRH